MLDRELLATCSEHHTKGINTMDGKNAEFLNGKHRWYTYSYHQALEKLINQTRKQPAHCRVQTSRETGKLPSWSRNVHFHHQLGKPGGASSHPVSVTTPSHLCFGLAGSPMEVLYA
jgi:hypothetical protein